MSKFRDQFNNRPGKKIQVFPKSQVQLRPSMSIKEMVETYVQTGQPPETQGFKTYFDEEFVEPQNFDLSDLSDAIETQKQIEKQQKQEAKLLKKQKQDAIADEKITTTKGNDEVKGGSDEGMTEANEVVPK